MTEPRPILRGYIHLASLVYFLFPVISLFMKIKETLFTPAIIYSSGLLGLFTVSSLYHRITWRKDLYLVMRRIDHLVIFLFIGCCFTPICLLVLKGEQGLYLLRLIWAVVAVGVIRALIWPKIPKQLSSFFYVLVGCFAVPYLPELSAALSSTNLTLLVSGGVCYLIGAICYATQKPNLYPGYFGFHEVFHIFVTIGAVLHFNLMENILLHS